MKSIVRVGTRRTRAPQQRQAIDLQRAAVEVRNLVLLAVAVGVLVAERLQHRIELVDVLRRLQLELVEPVLADPPAAARRAIGHVGDVVDVAVRRRDRLRDRAGSSAGRPSGWARADR